MLNAIDISTSGLIAQRQRMNTVAENIANVSTTRDESGNPAPFQRRLIQFSSQDGDSRHGGARVDYQIRVDTATPPRKVHDPGHPDADPAGYVNYPNINIVTEFVNALEASRAYEANVTALEITKRMSELSLRILS